MTRNTPGATAPRRSAAPRRHTPPAQRSAPAPRAPAGAAPVGDGGSGGAHPDGGVTAHAERTPAAARPSSVAFYAPHHHGPGPAHGTGQELRP